jgi:uncharacterized membrane protein
MKPPSKLLDRTFHAGITLKGLGGLTEIIGGILLFYFSPASLNHAVQFLFLEELARNPDGYFTGHILEATARITNGGAKFASIYLLSHGIIKVVLVMCLWMNKLWAYPLTIAVFAAFCGYQLHRFTHTHSVTLILLTIFDIALIYLTWKEYLQQRRILEEKGVLPS